MRNRFLTKVLSGLLTLSMAIGLSSGYSVPVSAYETDVNDGSVGGTGSEESAKGQWTTHGVEHTIYRVYPIVIPNPDTLQGDYQIPTDLYYTYRDLALYVTEIPEDMNAYYFTGSSTRGANKIADMTIDSSGSFDFSSLGLDLNLPSHTFTSTDFNYVAFSEELKSKIRTSGEDANIKEVFTNYMNVMESRYAGLPDYAKGDFDKLKEKIGWGTDYFDDYCKNTGLVFEVCSEATNKSGSRYVFSWQDLNESQVKGDAYYIYRVFNKAEGDGSLLSWNAVYEPTGVKLTSQYNGLATFLLMNATSSTSVSGSAYSQGINITLNYDGELKADTNIQNGVSSDFGITTTAVSDKLSVKLGDSSYKNTLTDAFANPSSGLVEAGLVSNSKNFTSSLLGSEGSSKSNNKLGISGGSDTEYTLNACGDKSSFGDATLIGYDTIQIPISADTLKLSSLYDLSGDISGLLSNITARASSQSIPNGWGSTYSLSFQSGGTTTRQSLADVIASKYTGSGVIKSYASKTNAGNLDTLANLQGATLLAGRVRGDIGGNGDVTGANGTIYASIAYLAKATNITSKEAEVVIDKDHNVQSSNGIDSKTYPSSTTASWAVKKDGDTYVLAWRASDYDLTDEKALAGSLMNAIGGDISGDSGAVQLTDAFKTVTGVQPLGTKYLKGDETVVVGAVAKEDKSLSGINVLVIKVSGAVTNITPIGDDLVDSNELNYIYPNLLGLHADVASILSMAEDVPDIKYDYTVSDSISGDLWSYKGSRVHYYYPVTGLFGVSSQSDKSFGATSYPSYAYNISRGLWGDSIVASSYRGLSATDEAVKTGITDDLGLSVGAVGNISPVTNGDNVDATYPEGRKDNYTFTGTIDREWYTTEEDEDGNSYEQKHTDTVTQTNSYSLAHSLNKYTCMPLPTAANEVRVGMSGFMINNRSGVDNKITLVSRSDKTVTVYPEVEYQYYQPSVSDGVLSNVEPLTVYCMGERARTMKPTVLRGINLKYQYGRRAVAEGKVTSSVAAVGTAASKYGMMTLPVGGDLGLGFDQYVDYELISYALDVVDEYNGVPVREQFSSDNQLYQPEKEHDDYVEAFLDGVNVDLNLVMTNDTLTRDYNNFGTSSLADIAEETEGTEIPLEFEYGYLTKSSKDAVINDMMLTYEISRDQATDMFRQSGFEEQLQEMFESSNDANNKSTNHWYDEKSVTLVLRKYITTVNFRSDLISSKIDYGTIGVTRDAKHNIYHNSLLCNFYLTVKIPDFFTVDGYKFNLVSKNILLDKQLIENTEFTVYSRSTLDMQH